MKRYVLNIAREQQANGRKYNEHYAKISLPDGLTEEQAFQRARIIGHLFQANAQGVYKVDLTVWEEIGRMIEI